MIRKLHHNAYRCRDSEETRRFYEDFLGLPLVQAFEIGRTKTGRETHALHTFYRLDDGSHLVAEVTVGSMIENEVHRVVDTPRHLKYRASLTAASPPCRFQP